MTQRPFLVAGLTGGIASGKTTVARMLAEAGAEVVDADRIAHELLAPGGDAFEDVLARFGRGILDAEGRIDRSALGAIVFRDAGARADLEAIVHPRVRREIDARVRRLRESGGGPVVVVEAALLVETGSHRGMDRLVVLRCDRQTQLRRLVERSGLSPQQARARIDAQAPLEPKLAVADYVIDTETSLDTTRRRAREVYESLVNEARDSR